MKPIISFIVPIYKIEEDYLNKCIESLRMIQAENVEFLLIDDGSPDNCGILCDDYSRMDNRIHSYHKENGGVSSARNYGIHKASGEYVTFIDADDWIDADKMDKLISIIREGRYDLYIHGQYIEFKNECPIQVRPFSCDRKFMQKNEIHELQKMVFVREYQSVRPYIGAGAICNAVDKVIRKSLLIEHNCFMNEAVHNCEDNLFYLKVFEYCSTVYYVDICIYHYRMRKSSASHTGKNVGYSDISIFYREAAAFIKKYKKDESYYEALCYRCFELLLEHFDRAYLDVQNKEITIFDKSKKLVKEMNSEPFCTILRTVKYGAYPIKNRIKLLLYKKNLSWLFLLFKQVKRELGMNNEKNAYY